MKRLLKRLYQTHIKPVHCVKCNGLLYRESERKAGISNRCAKAIEAHKARQIAETQELGNNGNPIPAAVNEDGREER